MKIDIEERHLKIVRETLGKYPYKFYVFGSRARGCAKKLSDLDLCIFDEISLVDLVLIEEAFEESDLPYKVDLVKWSSMNSDFRNLIKNHLILLSL